jgi:SAM-dependent methyltransferase
VAEAPPIGAGQIECDSGPEYGNWVSTRIVVAPAIVAAVLFVLAAGLYVFVLSWLAYVVLAVAVAAALVAAYFGFARALLAAGDGAVQARIQALVLDRLQWEGQGRALDIGCGNGPLSVALARRYPDAAVTGIDYWGESWEYSQGVCETNAACQGVAERVEFAKASAAALPFADGSFSAVVSNLCFHEVRGARDKGDLVKEALRVLEPGGAFAFQDLFRLKSAYGGIDELLAAVRGSGVGQVEFLDTGHSAFIPRVLRLPFMVGSMGVLYGRK